MNKELILFIAYEACRGNDFGLLERNPFQYDNAVRLISVNILLHIVQLVILLSNKSSLTNGQIGGVHLFVLMVGGMGIMFLMEFVFSKKVLAKAIMQYKDSMWDVRSKWIAFGYLFCNFILLGIVWVWRF